MKIKLELTADQITSLLNALVLAGIETHSSDDSKDYADLEKEIAYQAMTNKDDRELSIKAQSDAAWERDWLCSQIPENHEMGQ